MTHLRNESTRLAGSAQQSPAGERPSLARPAAHRHLRLFTPSRGAPRRVPGPARGASRAGVEADRRLSGDADRTVPRALPVNEVERRPTPVGLPVPARRHGTPYWDWDQHSLRLSLTAAELDVPCTVHPLGSWACGTLGLGEEVLMMDPNPLPVSSTALGLRTSWCRCPAEPWQLDVPFPQRADPTVALGAWHGTCRTTRAG